MKQIAIVVVGYNRIESITRLLDSISNAYYNCDNIPLIISIDKSDTDIVEKYADDFCWTHGEKIVTKHEDRMGLRKHILSQGKHFNKYDALIILEDDLTVSPNFYTYAQLTVDKYFDDLNIAGISLFSFGVNYQTSEAFLPLKDENDVYFMNCAQSWGQIWMKNQWQHFYKWYNGNIVFPKDSTALPMQICQWKESSWLKYHTRYCIENNLYFVYPYVSFTTNNGDSGTHNKGAYSNVNQERLQLGEVTNLKLPTFVPNQVVCYDGFFENKNLIKYLGDEYDDCCIDLNGNKLNNSRNRFWLTTYQCNYKIIKRFGVRYRPIEYNIIADTNGNDIFLYDTSLEEQNALNNRKFSRVIYDTRYDGVVPILRKYGLKKIILEFLSKIANKIRR